MMVADTDDALGGVCNDADYSIEGFNDELLAIDIESLVAARATQRVDQALSN